LYKIIVTLLILAAAGGGGYYYWEKKQAQAKADAPKAATAEVKRGSVKSSVSATGRVVANLDVDIKCKASGQVTKLPFDVSDPVSKGALILELDPIDEQRGVDQAKVALSSSTAKYVSAKQNLLVAEQKLSTDKMRAEAAMISVQARAERARIKSDRLKKALASSATTREEADTAETEAVQAAADVEIVRAQISELKQEELMLEVKRQDVNLADAQVKSDQIDLANAQQRLADTKVVAPIDGVVATRPVQIGQIISSGISNVGGGTTVLTISDLSHLYTVASVDESDIGKVQVGQDVEITADAYPGRRFKGKVVRIATRGANVSNVVTFEVKIEILDEKRKLLKPEMTTNNEIIAAKKDDVLLVPADAVSRKQGKRYVLIPKSEGAPEEREVEVGINDGTNIEITSGLKEADVVQLQKSDAESKWRGGGERRQGGGMPPGMFPIGGGGGRGR
jgi:HlyD family secretion protein